MTGRVWTTLGIVGGWIATSMSLTAWAGPANEVVYSNDVSGITVFKDARDARIFWYLPRYRLLVDRATGKVKTFVRRKVYRPRADGTVPVPPPSVPGASAPDQASLPKGDEPNWAEMTPTELKRFFARARGDGAGIENDEPMGVASLGVGEVRLRDAIASGGARRPAQAADMPDYAQGSASPDVRTEITFWVQPFFSDEDMREVARAVPGISSRQQLRPVVATQFAMLAPGYGVKVLSEPVTRLQYINSLNEFSLPLADDQYEEFKVLASGDPGVEAQMVIYFQGENVDSYLDASVSCKDVYESVRAGVSGSYVYSGADIVNAVSSLAMRTDVRIRQKGDIPVDAVATVINNCFMRVQGAALPGQPVIDGGAAPPQTPLPAGRDANGAPIAPSMAEILNSTSVRFSLRHDKIKNDTKFQVVHDKVSDRQESYSSKFHLRDRLESEPGRDLAAPLPRKSFAVTRDHTDRAPLRTGVVYKPSDELIVQASFNFFVPPFQRWTDFRALLMPLRWDPAWPSPQDQLFYRIGDAGWLPVNGRLTIPRRELWEGELQFHMDRTAVINKVPKSKRDTIVSRYGYVQMFPEFTVNLIGSRVKER